MCACMCVCMRVSACMCESVCVWVWECECRDCNLQFPVFIFPLTVVDGDSINMCLLTSEEDLSLDVNVSLPPH